MNKKSGVLVRQVVGLVISSFGAILAIYGNSNLTKGLGGVIVAVGLFIGQLK